MTEQDARDWLDTKFGTEAVKRLEHFTRLLLEEATRQSLIARSTFESIWSRHIVDSAQLVELAPAAGRWIDVGSGGGLPGLVVAILRHAPIVMVEPRRKRAEFLRTAIRELNLANASAVHGTIQAVSDHADVISARAVSSVGDLFAWTKGVVSRETSYLLPRGENAVSDLDIAVRAWQGEFHVKQSLTDPNAGIIVATKVRPR